MTKLSTRRGLRTTAIHAGEAPEPETGASAPNLVMSTTHALERPQGFSIHAIGEDAPYPNPRGAATLPLRMKAHGEGALAVAQFLESHPKVTRVLYPGLPSHPQHAPAGRQMDNFSGMMAFQVTAGPATAARLAARMSGGLEMIHYAVSLGHHRSLIYWIGTDDVAGLSFTLEGAQLDAYRAFAGDGVFRFSVGLEDPEDICADLERVL